MFLISHNSNREAVAEYARDACVIKTVFFILKNNMIQIPACCYLSRLSVCIAH